MQPAHHRFSRLVDLLQDMDARLRGPRARKPVPVRAPLGDAASAPLLAALPPAAAEFFANVGYDARWESVLPDPRVALVHTPSEQRLVFDRLGVDPQQVPVRPLALAQDGFSVWYLDLDADVEDPPVMGLNSDLDGPVVASPTFSRYVAQHLVTLAMGGGGRVAFEPSRPLSGELLLPDLHPGLMAAGGGLLLPYDDSVDAADARVWLAFSKVAELVQALPWDELPLAWLSGYVDPGKTPGNAGSLCFRGVSDDALLRGGDVTLLAAEGGRAQVLVHRDGARGAWMTRSILSTGAPSKQLYLLTDRADRKHYETWVRQLGGELTQRGGRKV
ncbi:MAG: hypothetical protein R3B40_10750 [Polyangiales bacterium]|nr:hypothetical protein [Myxococcales bacterium]MCB9658069.1 hypothetical protein [Sandaracinaceae bacterium]